MTMDIAQTRKNLITWLGEFQYEPRDADGSDFGSPHTDIRFKVGTSRGEVAITVWRGQEQIGVERILREAGFNAIKDRLTAWMWTP